MTDWQRDSESGLVTPAKPPEVPERVYGPLEFVDEDTRQRAHKHLGALVNMVQPGLVRPQPNKETMEKAIRHLAELLLGDDAGFEIPT